MFELSHLSCSNTRDCEHNQVTILLCELNPTHPLPFEHDIYLHVRDVVKRLLGRDIQFHNLGQA